MGNDKFLKLCKEIVVDYFNSRADKTDKNETYVDAYKKWENFTVKGE